MKNLTVNNARIILKKNRSLVKSTKDPTIVYIFSGHPYVSYTSQEDDDVLLMYSLTNNNYLEVNRRTLDSRKEQFFLIENEEDIVEYHQLMIKKRYVGRSAHLPQEKVQDE